jgi:hypothetical protein
MVAGAFIASAVASKYISDAQDKDCIFSLLNRPAPLTGFALGFFAARRSGAPPSAAAVLGVAGMLVLVDAMGATGTRERMVRLWSNGRDYTHRGFTGLPEMTRNPPSLSVNP